MSAIYDQLLNPISPAKVETLKRLYSVVGSMPVVLLGAFVRDLIFNHIHDIPVHRATKDTRAAQHDEGSSREVYSVSV